MAGYGWRYYKKHLLGEKSTGPNPTDKSRSGTKRSILVDGKGYTLGVCVDELTGMT